MDFTAQMARERNQLAGLPFSVRLLVRACGVGLRVVILLFPLLALWAGGLCDGPKTGVWRRSLGLLVEMKESVVKPDVTTLRVMISVRQKDGG